MILQGLNSKYLLVCLRQAFTLQILFTFWCCKASAKDFSKIEVDTYPIPSNANIKDSRQSYPQIILSQIISYSQRKYDVQNRSNENTNNIIDIPKTQESFIISQGSNRTTPTPPQQQPPTPEPYPKPPLEIPPSPVPGKPGFDIPGTITIKKFEFEGNKKGFSEQELREVTKDFLNKPISFTKLVEVENLINQLYIDAGYINSGAVIPAGQTLAKEGAVIKVEIIEGGIEEIKIIGTRRLKPSYIRSRIALGASRPLNRNKLLKALQLLQLDPLIQNISAELATGSRPEERLLEIKVVEADSFKTEFFADNGRAPSVGSFRRGVRVKQGNLLGFGDGLDFQYTNTDGSNAFDLSYAIPLNPRNGKLTLAGGITDTKVVQEPFDRVDITGDSFYIDIGYRQPILRTPTRELALGLNFSRQESKTKIQGESFPLSIGANEDGETRISVLRFFQEYTQRNTKQVFALRSQFNVGLDLFNATVNDDPPDGRFFYWRGQGQYVRQLAKDTLFVLRSDAQFTTRSLVPLERFGLGGLQSVRGYRQDALLTDNGFLTSAEVRLPVWRVKRLEGLLQVVPFIDFGVAWNSSNGPNNPAPDPNTLVGVGMGLQWQMGDYFTARLDYGIPLTDLNNGPDGDSLQEDGFYFSVNYSPF
ncbi:MAG: ShlB/FhaC/HecB family hemolysin secretion/activation protein [Calothrix sp. MO_167.B42]|nr:ShlB/FhaC/HecB family hemolysin secretion/activation protein [Calothrix sp. MO_167.B42]